MDVNKDVGGKGILCSKEHQSSRYKVRSKGFEQGTGVENIKK